MKKNNNAYIFSIAILSNIQIFPVNLKDKILNADGIDMPDLWLSAVNFNSSWKVANS
jgi:hypothetical protein